MNARRITALLFLVLFVLVLPVSAVCVKCGTGGNVTATIDVNYTFTGAPGTDALVTNIGNTTIALLDFTVPTGENGATGGNGGQVLYFHTTPAPDIAGYEGLYPIPAGGTEVDESVTVKNTLGQVIVDPYVTASGYPGLTTLSAGLWRFRTYQYVDGASGNTNAVFKVYNRTVSGTETLLFTATSEDINSLVPVEYLTSYVQTSDYTVLSTDRIVIKVYGQTTHSSNIMFHFVYEGTTHTSHVLTPLVTTATTADLSQYAYLPGRPNPQSLTGSSTSGGNLYLNGSSSNNGNIILNENGGNIGIGDNNPISYNSRNPVLSLSSVTGFPSIVLKSSSSTYPGNWEMWLNAVSTPSNSADFRISEGANNVLALTKVTHRLGLGTVTPNATEHIKTGTGHPSGQSAQYDNLIIEDSDYPYINLNAPTTGASGVLFSDNKYQQGFVYYDFPTDVLTLYSGSKVGVNTLTPTATFQSPGTVRFSSYGAGTATFDAGGNITSVSDEKFKTNIQPLKTNNKAPTTTAIQKILALNPVCWNYNAISGLDTTNKYCGLIAQDVEKIIPEAVYTKKDTIVIDDITKPEKDGKPLIKKEVETGTETHSIDERAIIDTMVLAMQEQQVVIENQNKEIDSLKLRLDKAGIK